MASIRDHILQGTLQAEEVLRDHGAWGRSFPDLVQNLATRKNMPRRVQSKVLSAHRICERVVRDPTPIHEFELHEWTQGINALLDWVRSQDKQSSNQLVDEPKVAETLRHANILPSFFRRREAGPRPWKLEAWMLIVALVLVVGLGGAVLRAVTARNTPESMTAEQALEGIQLSQDDPRHAHRIGAR